MGAKLVNGIENKRERALYLQDKTCGVELESQYNLRVTACTDSLIVYHGIGIRRGRI
jgi:hypothetical protein